MVSSQHTGDGSVGHQGTERAIHFRFELVVARAHGDGDVPVIDRHEFGGQLDIQLGRGVYDPACVGPEVCVVDGAVAQCFEGG